MKGWYFSNVDKKLRYGDNKDIAVGVTHTVDGPPVIYGNGLHASKNILDALYYALSPIVWRVELSGTIVHGDDRSVATERTYISGGIDISDILRKFARMCALDVIDLWDAPDIVIKYLKTGDESISNAARAAAWAAASAAALDVGWDAARDAAWAAAWAADAASAVTWAAASASASAAALAAAWDAASDAARDASAAASVAAWDARDAAMDAARAAAMEKKNKRLNDMVIYEIRRRK